MGHMLDEPLGLQPPQRLTNGCRANPEAVCEFFLPQPFARGDFTAPYCLPQPQHGRFGFGRFSGPCDFLYAHLVSPSPIRFCRVIHRVVDISRSWVTSPMSDDDDQGTSPAQMASPVKPPHPMAMNGYAFYLMRLD